MARAYTIFGLTCWLVAGWSSAFAETAEDQKHAALEIVDQLADCSAYYNVVTACARNMQGDVARSAEEGETMARNHATDLIYQFGKFADMSDAALLATLKLANEKALSETNKGCQNLAVLIAERAKVCKTVIEHPDTVFINKLSK